ncbi:MAG: queuosine precursor transporter, partial [Fervidobacterium sp.]
MKTEKRIMLFTTLFITGIVISNVLASKVVKLGIFVFPASIVSYTFTFILSNMVSDVIDRRYSKYLIFMGFLAQATASGLILVSLFMPALSIEKSEAYKLILGTNWRFTLSSLLAYGASQLINHYVFNKAFFKNTFFSNLLSVVIAQLVDTLVFTYVAFFGVYP